MNASNSHLLMLPTPVATGCPFLKIISIEMPRMGEAIEWVFSNQTERVQAVFPGCLALEDENSYVTAAEAGLGIAQLPAFVVKEAMERGALDLVLPEWFPEPLPLQVVYPQSRQLSRRVRVLVE